MKLILLIGFSRGLGRALFQQILTKLEPGKTELLAIGRSIENLKNHDAVTYIEADLLKSDCWDFISESIPSNTNSIELFVNAAVVEPINRAGFLDDELLEQAVQVNYLAPMKLINQLVNLQSKSTLNINVINISSGAATKPVEGWSAYCSTKAALKMFLDVVNIESGEAVNVTHIDPGVINTDMQKTIRSKSENSMKNVQQFKELKNSNKLKSPEEAARDVLVYLEPS